MRYKPHHFQGAIINRKVWIEMVVYGAMVTAILLTQFAYAENISAIAASSIAFTGLVVYELVRLVALRTNYKIPWFSNPWLTVAIVSSFLILLAVMYVDSLAELFVIQPISLNAWATIALASAVIFVVMKLTRRLLDRFLEEARPQFSSEHYEHLQ